MSDSGCTATTLLPLASPSQVPVRNEEMSGSTNFISANTSNASLSTLAASQRPLTAPPSQLHILQPPSSSSGVGAAAASEGGTFLDRDALLALQKFAVRVVDFVVDFEQALAERRQTLEGRSATRQAITPLNNVQGDSTTELPRPRGAKGSRASVYLATSPTPQQQLQQLFGESVSALAGSYDDEAVGEKRTDPDDERTVVHPFCVAGISASESSSVRASPLPQSQPAQKPTALPEIDDADDRLIAVVADHVVRLKGPPIGAVFAALKLDFPVESLFAPSTTTTVTATPQKPSSPTAQTTAPIALREIEATLPAPSIDLGAPPPMPPPPFAPTLTVRDLKVQIREFDVIDDDNDAPATDDASRRKQSLRTIGGSSADDSHDGSGSYEEGAERDEDRMRRKSTAFTSSLHKEVADDGFKTLNTPHNRYTILREIGRGSFGKVKLACVGDTNEMRAIKIIPKKLLKDKYSAPMKDAKSGAATTRFWGEVEIMKKLKHRNIVRLFEVIDDPESQKLYLVMQYVERGPIVNLDPATGTCTPLDIEVARGYMKQIVNAVAYMHSQRICHRDIKPDAILLGANGLPYLVDFGVSSMMRDDEDDTDGETAGSPQFWAPEMFVDDVLSINSLPNPFAADVWALGVSFYAMIYGRLPFRCCKTLAELGDEVRNAPILFGPMELEASANYGRSPTDVNLSLRSDSGSPFANAVPPVDVRPISPGAYGSTATPRSPAARSSSEATAAEPLSRTSSAMGMSLVCSIDDTRRETEELCIDLLRRMLDKDATRRITIRQIRKHAFICPNGGAVAGSGLVAALGSASPFGAHRSFAAGASVSEQRRRDMVSAAGVHPLASVGSRDDLVALVEFPSLVPGSPQASLAKKSATGSASFGGPSPTTAPQAAPRQQQHQLPALPRNDWSATEISSLATRSVDAPPVTPPLRPHTWSNQDDITPLLGPSDMPMPRDVPALAAGALGTRITAAPRDCVANASPSPSNDDSVLVSAEQLRSPALGHHAH